MRCERDGEGVASRLISDSPYFAMLPLDPTDLCEPRSGQEAMKLFIYIYIYIYIVAIMI